MSSQGFHGLGGGHDDHDDRDGRDRRDHPGGADETGTSDTSSTSDTSAPPDSAAEVSAYAAEVRAQFADLPEADSAELLEDLEDHLSEVAAEDAGTLRERLGAPAAYARELRQAAGLPEPGEGSGGGAGPRSRRTLRAKVRQAVADAERRARGHRAGREVLDFLPSLRPAWWVVRGWAAVRLLEAMTTSSDVWHHFSLIPRVGDSTFVGLIALLVAVPASVYAARQTVPEGWRRRTMGAGEGILALFTVGLALTSIGGWNDYGGRTSGVSYVQQSQDGLVDNGKQITNLYVYDHSGKQLGDVFVYDQDGQPVTTSMFGGPFVENDEWLDGNGSQVLNLFPVRLLQSQWSDADGGEHLVAVPPPTVTVPQGVHRASSPGVTGAQPPSALPSVPASGPTTG